MKIYILFIINGDCGLWIGDWGDGEWGVGDRAKPQSPNPLPQIPNPQSPFCKFLNMHKQ